MREYLFRGKKYNGEWVEGYFACICGYFYILTGKIVITNVRVDYEKYEVDPETVGRYTGIRDCKRTEEYPDGQMIFEGDIVVCDRHISDEFDKKTFFVREIYPISGLIGESLSGNEICGDDWEFAEVIGNIHDNPEQMKEGGEE